MSRTPNRRRVAKLAVTVALLVGLAGCRGMNSNDPPIHLNPNMDEQKRFDPQEANEFFADRRAMRQDIPGTIAVSSGAQDETYLTGREAAAVPAGATTAASTDATTSFSARLPESIVLDRALLERGKQRYDIYCAPCHDSTGSGKGTVPSRADEGKPWTPPSFHDDRLRALPLGQLYDIITNGVRTMPPYASHMSPSDRWAVAAYVRTLQRSRMATVAQVPPEVVTEKGWTP